MSKFDLRDVSERLARSRDTEAVVFEFLGYLQAMQTDWRASLSFYEVSQDALVNLYERQGNRLVRRDISLPVDRLPARLVRKFFHPSAFFTHAARRSLLSHLFGSAPYYEPDPSEAAALRPVTAIPHWQSCVCLPIADQEDMLAMLVLSSEKKNAFGSKLVGDLIPVKSMAALALAQHLYKAARANEDGAPAGRNVPAAAAEFTERIERLDQHRRELEADNHAKSQKLESLSGEIELLDKNSTQYKQELERVKLTLFALEEQTTAATIHLTEAYSELNTTRARMTELQRTVRFMKEVFSVLAQEHDREEFPGTMVEWFCEHFHIDRCSLMLLDGSGQTLTIAAQRGIDPHVAERVKVRLGQGIAGWVAHNRKPLFVRVREEEGDAPHSGRDAYNSDSFICAPLTFNDKVCGVLNLSNKAEGEPFDEYDLDRAMLASSVIAMTLGGHEMARRTAAWS
jgi:putative methionine-R-sulfoxide reductase with GAF domain